MRRIAAQMLFTGADFIRNGLLTLDASGSVLEVSSLGDTIVEQRSTEFYNGILCPGFINAHCHLELSHMLGILPSGGGMTAFCRGMIESRNAISEAEQLTFMREADRQMSAEGIRSVGDVSNSAMSFELKRRSGIQYHTFVECFGLDASLSKEIVQRASAVNKSAEKLGISSSITPHSAYSMSEALFSASIKRGIKSGIISIHNQESADETQLFKFKSGKMTDLFGSAVDEFLFRYDSPLHRIFSYVDDKTRLLLIHNVYTTPADYQYACSRNGNIAWILCPSSNIYIENRLPDVNLFVNNDAHVAIGTDSLASNDRLSMMHELKLLDTHFPKIGLRRLLRWATSNGAAALNIEDKFGSFTPGTAPGVILISGIDFANMRLTNDSKARRIDV